MEVFNINLKRPVKSMGTEWNLIIDRRKEVTYTLVISFCFYGTLKEIK
jgi:hypothetical protein